MTASTWPTGPVEVAETHVSATFFVGDRAWKLKKPVRLPFVDLSERATRRWLCEREVELNRRLAPDVYLGVADIVGPDGRVCDHLVVMKRMPADRRLASLVGGSGGTDADVAAAVRAVCEMVAGLHRRADRGPDIDAAADPAAVRRRWHDNLDEMARHAGLLVAPDRLSAVRRLADRFVDGRRSLFEQRIADGRVCDGHGDLLADDIFLLADGPRILDCLEFDDQLRYGDGVADIAFLAMDVERLGAVHLAHQILDWYCQAAGDDAPPGLIHHYIAYRALVRSKVACVRATQADDGVVGTQAARLLELCLAHLEAGRVRLVLVGGLPGRGKTTLARTLGDHFGWRVVSSDEVRRELAGGDTGVVDAALDEGRYRSVHTAATYRELLRRARRLLEGGHSVVLDASWSSADWRRAAGALAALTASELTELQCVATDRIAGERLARRMARPHGSTAVDDPSDAGPAVAAAMAGRFEPWPTSWVIDTSRSHDESLARALLSLGQASTAASTAPEKASGAVG